MTRDELGALLRLLVDTGRITAAQAADLVRRFDLGEWVIADLPVRLSDLPGRLTPEELAVAMQAVAVRLTPTQAARFLSTATRPVTTQTPPEVRRFLRERLRNSFRADYERRVAGITQAMADGGDVAGWQKLMLREQRSYIARQMTAGLGRALAAPELETVNTLTIQQQNYLYRFAGEISARRALGNPYTPAYLQNRAAQYGGVGWEVFFRGNENVEARGDGYVARYDAVDDHRTCGPCLEAQRNSPYLPSAGPFPGQVCRAHGRCRCRREIVFDMDAWRELTEG